MWDFSGSTLGTTGHDNDVDWGRPAARTVPTLLRLIELQTTQTSPMSYDMVPLKMSFEEVPLLVFSLQVPSSVQHLALGRTLFDSRGTPC